eukprot:TRINITY_DN17565_c0_g1_i1.p1 TRINITY_DN17565_c0_g1~~TRINITY_DN17565_c0_g1_i1.p1  ORF type:complete len:246 (+),score=35.77 TRINITY_DN17565_c0_g1_i1:99-836(+)
MPRKRCFVRDSEMPLAPFIRYSQIHRTILKEQNPHKSFGEISTMLSAMWKTLPPESRQNYNTHSNINHVSPQELDPESIQADLSDNENQKKRKKRPKDLPKMPKTAFIIFSNEVRSAVKQANEGIGFCEMGRMIGEQWASLAPSARKRYEILANQDRERYELEMRDRNIPLRKDRGCSEGSKTREGEKAGIESSVMVQGDGVDYQQRHLPSVTSDTIYSQRNSHNYSIGARFGGLMPSPHQHSYN